MHIGYARISTEDQTLHLQEDALTRAGCEKLLKDIASGARTERPGLTKALEQLRAGDTLVVWRLDRLGRSLQHLIETLTALDKQGIGFQSLTEHIDTTTPGGKLVFHIFGALAEFERELIRERTTAGLVAARARGRRGGHPTVKAFRNPAALALARSLFANPTTPIDDICRQFGVSHSTLYRYMGGKRPVTKDAALAAEPEAQP